jgi:hypothetical protein
MKTSDPIVLLHLLSYKDQNAEHVKPHETLRG